MFSSHNNDAFASIIGRSPAIESLIRSAQIVAAADVPVLIEGDTGTGKELLARALHQSSSRADKPMVTINCAALHADIVEASLFGHEAGAFTDARERRDGYVQRAAGGILFLDEIAELPLPLQAKFLRLVEFGECQRVGSNEIEKVDIRIFAATHTDLLKRIDQGYFRQDLFYRLSVVNLRLPTLYERRRDIPMLAEHFLREIAARSHAPACHFSDDALSLLRQYRWPGNIRELKNVCEHVSALLPGETIGKDNLPHDILQTGKAVSTGYSLPEHGIDMEQLEIDLIKQALEHANGNKSRAARLLGLSRDAFMYRLKKHGL